MRKKLHFRYWLSFTVLIILLLILVFWNINSGSIPISLKDVFRILFQKEGDQTAYNIVWEIRLPRILAAVILGGALSVSGFLLQTFFGNPIAGPFVLGISSGAKLVVALTKIYGCHIRSHDHCGIYRFSDFYGICPSDLKESKTDVHAGGKWYYDWIYLFGCDRFCSHFCRRFQHCKSS